MNLHRKVFITFNFDAMHQWPEAPKECLYLRNEHRHLFHVRMDFTVNHDDRDIEFITKKEEVLRYVREVYEGRNIGRTSCEEIAKVLLQRFMADRVEVSEDGENGAVLERK